MLALNTIIFVYSLFYISDAAYVDTIPRCSVKDSECLRSAYQKVIKDVGKTGISELNFPPIDPMKLKNINLTLFDTVQLTITDGSATGMGDCIFNDFRLDMEKLMAYHKITCDIVLECDSIVSGKNADLEAAIGISSLYGQGDGKLILEKLNVKYDVPFKVFKKNDGEVYLEVLPDGVKYKYKLENVKYSAKHITVGGVDVTPLVVAYINGNWRELIKFAGEKLLGVGTKIYFDIANHLLTRVPTRKYIIEDLSAYIGK